MTTDCPITIRCPMCDKWNLVGSAGKGGGMREGGREADRQTLEEDWVLHLVTNIEAVRPPKGELDGVPDDCARRPATAHAHPRAHGDKAMEAMAGDPKPVHGRS